MKVNHENPQLEEIINEIVLTCVKFGIHHRIVTHPNHFAYEIEINHKIKKGLVLHINDIPFFINPSNPHLWIINNKQTANPYVCCDNVFINLLDFDEDYFCIHNTYFYDEILSYLH